MGIFMTFALRVAALLFAAAISFSVPAAAQQQRQRDSFGSDELVTAGHRFFGNVSRGLASIIERAVSRWGLPNGYVLGEEGHEHLKDEPLRERPLDAAVDHQVEAGRELVGR